MGLASLTNRLLFSGTGSTTDFSFPYYFIDEEDLTVVLLDATGEESVLVLDTDYSVSGTLTNGAYAAGASVSLDTAPAVGETLLIYRAPVMTQDLDLIENDSLPVEEVEKALDKNVMISQYLADKASRTVRIEETDDATVVLTLPRAEDRASKFMAFDADGRPIASDGGISGSVTVSSFGANLVDDADAAAGRSTLGMGSAGAIQTLAGFGGTSHFVTAGDIDLDFVSDQTAKTLPISADLLLLGDSEASNATKYVTLANLLKTLDAQRNHLYNGDFRIWQRGTSTTVANGSTTYLADRWYAKNSLGTAGVLTYSRVAGSNWRTLYGAKVQITTAPTASQVNGCELYQTLENTDSIIIYETDDYLSFACKVKALGSVTSVGVSIMAKTTEGKVDTLMGTETVLTVNSSTFADGVARTIVNSGYGAGSFGVRIRILGVSGGGNTYDVNNGFIVELCTLTQGSAPAKFRPRCGSFAAEVAACERYFEKSYDLGTLPGGTSTTVGANTYRASATNFEAPVQFKNRKRTTPSVTLYNSKTGATTTWHDVDADTAIAFTAGDVGDSRFIATSSATADGRRVRGHWVADAEI